MSAKMCEKTMSDFFLQNEAKCCAGSQLVFCTIKNKRNTHTKIVKNLTNIKRTCGERERKYICTRKILNNSTRNYETTKLLKVSNYRDVTNRFKTELK